MKQVYLAFLFAILLVVNAQPDTVGPAGSSGPAGVSPALGAAGASPSPGAGGAAGGASPSPGMSPGMSPSPSGADMGVSPSPPMGMDDSMGAAGANSSDFSCWVNAGPQPGGKNGVTPQPAANANGATYCYKAQMPNGTCTDANCTDAQFVWQYGVAEKAGCDSFKQQEATGVYKNVLCCNTPQCNAPDAGDTSVVKLDNPNVPTIAGAGSSSTNSTLDADSEGMNSTVTATDGAAGGATTTGGSTTTSRSAGAASANATSGNRTSNSTSGAWVASAGSLIALMMSLAAWMAV